MGATSEVSGSNFDQARYATAWRRYKVLRILFCFLGIGWFPFVFGIVILSDHWNLGSTRNYTAMVAWFLVFIWVIAACVVGSMRIRWPCPRCGKSFRGFFRPLLPKRCVHCGLPRWASRGDQ